MENLDRYVTMLNEAYQMGTNNHPEHNSNPKYWDILLGDIKSNPEKWNNKKALDFGCGKGRNVTNMLSLSNWNRVDGIDVSESNINYCKTSYLNQNSNFYKNDGLNLSDLNDNEYDFIMSTIVFQHICVHELRYKLKEEIYRVLKPQGEFSFQMGYGPLEWAGHTQQRSYFENGYDASNSNGSNDVRVSDPQDLINDLTQIGFKDIVYHIEEPWEDWGHPNWIYVKCYK
jgi:SAM-dependent methyltransferase